MNAEAATEADAVGLGRFRPLRIWVPVLLLLLMVTARFVPNVIQDGPSWLWVSAAFGPVLTGFLIGLWWVALSRANWLERVIGVLGIAVAFGLTLALLDPSMLGPAVMGITIPIGMAAFAIAAIACSRMLSMKRTLIAVVAATAGFGFSTALRGEGMWGDFAFGLDWRWNKTAEENFLASRSEATPASIDATREDYFTNPEWPAFRGLHRDGVQVGALVESDWESRPPEELWRILVGPAWSSFTVAGPLLYTQEQRDTLESVVCYAADTGQEVWSQGVESRFSDPLGGPGPRATPTLAGDNLYAMGAAGWLLKLDARDGSLNWQTDLSEVASREPPMWGFSSSPLVVDDLVVVYAGGEDDKGILAFDVADGQLRWSAAAAPQSYGSLQIITVDERALIAILTDQGLQLHEPQDGTVALVYEWKHQGYRALQPQLVGSDSILIPTGMGTGTRLIQIVSEDSGLQAKERWTSRDLKPDFNDLVVLDGYAYGFDGSIFACLDLATGKRAWRGGRYGKGQVLLLRDSKLLVVASERGDVILLQADPSGHQELAKLKALEGKTWNHPVVVGDRLFVRNASEAVCYRLPMVSESNTMQSTVSTSSE